MGYALMYLNFLPYIFGQVYPRTDAILGEIFQNRILQEVVWGAYIARRCAMVWIYLLVAWTSPYIAYM